MNCTLTWMPQYPIRNFWPAMKRVEFGFTRYFIFFKASEIMTHFSLILMVPKCKMRWIWFLFQQSIVKMVFLNWNKPFWMTSSCRLMVDSLLLVPTTIWCWSSNRQAKISFSRFCLILWFFFHHCAFFQICHYRAFLP